VEKPTTWLIFSFGHRRCGNPSMERPWAGCRFAKANEHPVPVGLFLSGNRLSSGS